jgi:hypothetical protein
VRGHGAAIGIGQRTLALSGPLDPLAQGVLLAALLA